jgi:hypothetical protein
VAKITIFWVPVSGASERILSDLLCGILEDVMFIHRALSLLALVTPLYLGLLEPALADPPAIGWEIENRFRYFQKASDFRAIAKVYDSIKTTANPFPSALQLERALEQKVVDGSLVGLRSLDKHDGWAASVLENTCGREKEIPGQKKKHDHRNCKMENGDDYLTPSRANLLVHAEGITASSCGWWMDGILVKTSKCDKANVEKIADVKYGESHTLEIRPSNGQPIKIQIVIKDALIISLGDSFSAGEGNPEKPVRLIRDNYNEYEQSSLGIFFPVREDLTNVKDNEQTDDHFFQDLAPVWTNSQCHQSLYSQHTKAALQYALEHPHLTVTYMNYSCTGAGVYEGILNAWWARDDVQSGNYDDAPQLVKALRDLCRDQKPYKNTKWAVHSRNESDYDSKPAQVPPCGAFVRETVDALLLSIGGNDVGFANMISNSAIDVPTTGKFSKGRKWIYGLWREASEPQSFQNGLELANDRIAKRYKVLDKTFEDHLSVESRKVVLSTYPNINADEKGELCKPNNLGMDVHPIFGMYDANIWSDSSKFVGSFHHIMKSAADDLHWKFADQHIAQPGAENHFVKDVDGKGHGICAAGPVGAIAGIMQFPRPKPHTVPPMQWSSFQPEEWRAYSNRNRWFVTPNDSFLTTNYHDAEMESVMDPVQPLYAATLSGSFHPNALGHAAIADSVLLRLREVLEPFEDISQHNGP